jgi:hypothetical protein
MLSIVCPMLPSLIDVFDSSVVGMVNFNITRILSLLSPAGALRGSLSSAKQFTPVGKSDASPKWSISAVACAPPDVVNFLELRQETV